MSSRALVAALLAVGLAACATQEDPGRSAPRDPGAATQWQNLGVTPNGNILHELDKQSIVRHGDVVTFRDRKTIFNLKWETFTSLPRHRCRSTAGGLTARRKPINCWPVACLMKWQAGGQLYV